MRRVSVEEAQRGLAELIRLADAGEEVVIEAEDGTAVRLVPVPRPRFGSGRGMFEMADDFDEPLADFAPSER